MQEELIQLKCECGNEFERPLRYKVWNEENTNVVFRWKLKYCDTCFHAKAKKALKRLPEIINNLVNDRVPPQQVGEIMPRGEK